MKSLILVAALLCLTRSISAQPLVPGNRVPFTAIACMRQNKPDVLSLTGKYTLLSFFSKSCMACLQSLPKLQWLQKTHPGRLQVIMVTRQDIANTIWEKRIANEESLLYYITKDSMLSKLFPHESVPHEIWIDNNGYVSGITGAEAITDRQVAAWLEDRPVVLPYKNDLIGFDLRQPLMTAPGVHKLLVTDSSVVAGYIPGQAAATGFVRSADKKTKRIFLVNQSLAELLSYGLPWALTSRTVIYTNDSTRFFNPGQAEQKFCYEITVPASLNIIEINRRIRKDISAFFLVSSYIDCRTDADGCLTDHLVIDDTLIR